MKQKGFSLIELLVVIAIVGILSAVILSAVSNARKSGKDASAQSSIESIRGAAEIYSSNNANKYSNAGTHVLEGNLDGVITPGNASLCVDPDSVKLANAANVQTGNHVLCSVGQNAKSYVVYTVLLGSAADHAYCIDSSGFAGDVQYTNTGATYVAGTSGLDAKCK
jgi:prepilin-type N-terminal cleavage/methylation domain-containing protein